MKLIRLPSGPLACVFSVEEEDAESTYSDGKISGVYRAFSGSVEADGESEELAIEALDLQVRRLSAPPPAEVTAFEISRSVANDVGSVNRPGIADTTGSYRRLSEFDTLPAPAMQAPASSSRRGSKG
jgi:hypothetical protein